jgi:hypothetical protein
MVLSCLDPSADAYCIFLPLLSLCVRQETRDKSHGPSLILTLFINISENLKLTWKNKIGKLYKIKTKDAKIIDDLWYELLKSKRQS